MVGQTITMASANEGMTLWPPKNRHLGICKRNSSVDPPAMTEAMPQRIWDQKLVWSTVAPASPAGVAAWLCSAWIILSVITAMTGTVLT